MPLQNKRRRELMKTNRTLVQRSPCWYEAHVCDGSSKSRLDGPGDAFQLPHLAQGPTMSLSDREQFNCLLLSALGRNRKTKRRSQTRNFKTGRKKACVPIFWALRENKPQLILIVG